MTCLLYMQLEFSQVDYVMHLLVQNPALISNVLLMHSFKYSYTELKSELQLYKKRFCKKCGFLFRKYSWYIDIDYMVFYYLQNVPGIKTYVVSFRNLVNNFSNCQVIRGKISASEYEN